MRDGFVKVAAVTPDIRVADGNYVRVMPDPTTKYL